jgi:predicted DsbA family dithiol-disulfide isomerase
MKHSIWFEDPPSSSYPSCIAVKTAGLQSDSAADKLLSLIRKALMEDGKNVSRQEVLFELAAHMDGDNFSLSKFMDDWKKKKGIDAFRDDVKKAKFHNIGRYPTLTFTNKKGEGMMITGYRPYAALRDSFLFASAELNK